VKQKTVDELTKIACEAQEKLAAIKAEEFRRANAPKVGKTFKTRNNFSCPEKPSDYWWLYSKVTRMDNDGMLYATYFQTDKYGNISVCFDHYAYHMQGHQQIPAAEFNRAWKKMVAKVGRKP
jgi:hypothetical protein